MKKIIADICKNNTVIRKISRSLFVSYKRAKYLPSKSKKVNDKQIVFEVYDGRNYGCSPKNIYEKMLTMDEFKDYTFIWAFINPESKSIPMSERTKLVKVGTKEYMEAYATSKYWIVNSIVNDGFTKKKNQVYVQCWHGTPLKKLRCDIEVNGAAFNSVSENRKRNEIDAKRYDYFISPSEYCTEKFNSAFDLKRLHDKDIIIEKGYPRNDTLFNRSAEDIQSIKNRLNISKDKKVLFYMPTFRDNSRTLGVGYTYEIAIDFDSLKKKFGDEYVILFSPHYFIANKVDVSKYDGFVIDVSKNDDINDLYLVSDVLLTDYSSVFFDYANLHRPMLFFMYDLDVYKGELRDFYISLDELPGPIAKTQEELENYLENINDLFLENKEKYTKFNEKYNYLDDGNASERVIREIFNI